MKKTSGITSAPPNLNLNKLEPTKNELKTPALAPEPKVAVTPDDAFTDPVKADAVPVAKEGFEPLPSLSLGETSQFSQLLGASKEKLAPAPSPTLSAAIDRVVGQFARIAPTLSEENRTYLKSHLTDLIKVFAQLEKWPPAVVIFGSARSKPAGTPNAHPAHLKLYQDTKDLAAVVAQLGLPERDGAGPGAMKAAGEGFIEAREAVERGELERIPHQIDVGGISGLADNTFMGSLKTQGVKIELNPAEMTFEQNVESDNEEHVVSENFLARKVGLWANALMTIVDEGGFGTTEELLEVAALVEEGSIKDPLVIKNSSVWAKFVDALAQHSAAKKETLENIHRIDTNEEITGILEKQQLVGFEQPGAQMLENLASDLMLGVQKLSGFPPGVTLLGADKYPLGSPSRQRISELAGLLTKAGIPIRTTGAEHTAEAIARGIRSVGGSTQELQLFPYHGDLAPKICGVTPDHTFDNFIIQKELISRESRPIVLDTPDIRSISILFSELTQVQTKEHAPKPIILMGKKEWEPILGSVVPTMLELKTISEGDDKLFKLVDSAQEAAELIIDFVRQQETAPAAAEA